jgi:hypothetical protein
MAASVALTTFMDFVVASGTRRITCVRKAKKQYGQKYDPRTDFYKPLREGIVEIHKTGGDMSRLANVLAKVTDPKKLTSYPKCLSGYSECLADKSTVYVPFKPRIWHSSGLDVRVSPEVMLEIDGERFAIKLYFKAEPIPQSAIAPMLRMIELSVPKSAEAKPAVIDLQRAKMHTRDKLDPNLDALLLAEAASFAVLWDALE